MAGKKRNSSFEILTAMQDLNTPAGALQLAQILHLPSASIGRELLEIKMNFDRNVSCFIFVNAWRKQGCLSRCRTRGGS